MWRRLDCYIHRTRETFVRETRAVGTANGHVLLEAVTSLFTIVALRASVYHYEKKNTYQLASRHDYSPSCCTSFSYYSSYTTP